MNCIKIKIIRIAQQLKIFMYENLDNLRLKLVVKSKFKCKNNINAKNPNLNDWYNKVANLKATVNQSWIIHITFYIQSI